MPKILSIFLCVITLLSLAACAPSNTSSDSISSNTLETSIMSSNDYIDNDQSNDEADILVKNILGEWKLQSQSYSDGRPSNWKLQTIKLYEDGTCSVNGEIGTWKIVDEELMILGSYGGRFWYSDAIVGKFSYDGDILKFYEAQIDGKSNGVNLSYIKSK